MADVKMDLNWDIQDGNIVFYVSVGDQDLAALTLDAESIIDSFRADCEDINDDLQDWIKLGDNLSKVIDAIVYGPPETPLFPNPEKENDHERPTD